MEHLRYYGMGLVALAVITAAAGLFGLLIVGCLYFGQAQWGDNGEWFALAPLLLPLPWALGATLLRN